jgi:hypothetical protein
MIWLPNLIPQPILMAKAKTKPTEQSVETFLDTVSGEKVRDDCRAIIQLMGKVTGEKPRMWGPSIVGFGSYHYKYESGHEGDICLTGFSRESKTCRYMFWRGSPDRKPFSENWENTRWGKDVCTSKN